MNNYGSVINLRNMSNKHARALKAYAALRGEPVHKTVEFIIESYLRDNSYGNLIINEERLNK